jgi:hypothetical protein
MLPLLLAAIIFVFLVLGSLVFLVCVLVPPARRYALSAAAWCAMWGPCSVGFLSIAGVGLIADAFISKSQDAHVLHFPKLIAVFGWSYLVASLITTIILATGTAWLHQWLIHRLTFALFRLYAAIVCAGIGSVFGWGLGWWMLWQEVTHHVLPWWGLGMLVLIFAFGTAAYKARAFCEETRQWD